jgi:hypothetical protein
MTSVKVVALVFDKGYHVGWREPRRIVDHITVLRALIYVSHLTGAKKCAELLTRGELEASALLPTIDVGREIRLLAPFPKIPCLGKVSRIRGLFTTLATLKHIVSYIAKCISSGGTPVARESQDKVVVDCVGGTIQPLELYRVKGVVYIANECSALAPYVPEEFYELVTEYRNRIDRLSGSADVYEVYGVKPLTPLWLALRGSEEAIRCGTNLLEVLQRFGIGGLRSRGWGKFSLDLQPHVSLNDLDVLKMFSGWVKGLNYILGFMTPGNWLDLGNTYATREIVTGRSGPSVNEYRLSIIYVMDIGSIIYAKEVPKPRVIPVDSGKATIVFNPVTIHA